MYIKTLEIEGFRLFAHKTKIEFDPGINIIVGPNECGKSTILESINWCLGNGHHQSSIHSRLQDRPTANYTEVNITFNNSDILTRRLSDENTCLINDTKVDTSCLKIKCFDEDCVPLIKDNSDKVKKFIAFIQGVSCNFQVFIVTHNRDIIKIGNKIIGLILDKKNNPQIILPKLSRD